MAERVPTTIGASPRRMRRHCSLRSSGRQRGVQQRHVLPEGRIQQPHHLRRQPNLRNQQDRRQPPVKRPLHGRQIDRGLSRARYSMEQKGMECPQRRRHAGQRIQSAARSA